MRRARSPIVRSLCAVALLLGAGACARRGTRAPDGPTSQIEADAYVRRAIRSSSEGVILMPSQRAERVFELPRLNEIAQGLRGPAARCFLQRAIETMETMERAEGGEQGYAHVPEGQMKVRTRIAPSGEVVRTEVLESGFVDEQMEPCIREVLEEQRWPPNKSGNTHYIDVIYWVSLGMQREAGTEATALHVRREQIAAGRRAKACLQGRVDAGRYEITGLNLVDREGGTMVNRIDTLDLPEPIRACLATALREIRLPRDPEAFVRPVSPTVVFDVDRDGTVRVEGEKWLELVELEERARRAAERAALAAEDPELVDELPAHRPADPVQPGAAGLAHGGLEPEPGASEAEPGASEAGESDPPPAEPPPKAQDPGQGGLRLDLGGRRRGDDA
ncbi:MAG: hypothetical protein KDK70_28350 [Myxococcales bacterium]|nr:hypothetical protein [Myxococcales bacterium]